MAGDLLASPASCDILGHWSVTIADWASRRASKVAKTLRKKKEKKESKVKNTSPNVSAGSNADFSNVITQ